MALSDFITNTLGANLVSYSGWSAGDTTFVTSNTLRVYGVTNESDASDISKLYAIAKVESFKQVLSLISTKYSFSADGGNFSRSNVFDAVEKLYQDAISEAMVYLPANNVRVGNVDFTQNPYGLDSFTRSLLGY